MNKVDKIISKTSFIGIVLFFLLSMVLFSQNSIFTNQTPSGVGNDSDYELGTKFTTTQNAIITKIKYYKTAGETGSHSGKIWNANGEKLAEVSFTNESNFGWQIAELTSPILVFPGNVYIVSVNANTEYAYTSNELAVQISNGFLSSVADNNNGVFNDTPELFPSQSFNNSNYYRDIEAEAVFSLFSSESPASEYNDGPYEMGLKFTSSQPAKVKAITFYKTNNETGTHIGNIWTSSGQLLASVVFTDETVSGWQYAFLPNPVNISPNTTYIVSVNSNTAYGASANGALDSPIVNGILSTVADNNNGVYSGAPNTQGQFPTQSYLNTNYFRDVVIEQIYIPNLPSLISPSTNETNVSIVPILTWSQVAGADSYTLELATDQSFNDLVYSQSGLTTNSVSISGLLNNKNYYWRVSAENFAGSSGFSNSNFKTIKAFQPYLSYPIGGAITYSNPLTLSWYLMTSSAGIKYDLFYSVDPGLNSPTLISDISSSSTSISGLLPGTTYYWQVRSKSSSGAVSYYSNIESFKTNGEAVTPIPSYPVTNDIIYSYSPTLYWYITAYDAGLKYEIEFREGDVSNLTGNPTVTDLSQLNFQLSNLDDDTEYSWQVRSKLGTTYSDWSEKVTFKTVKKVSNPIKPILAWPINDAIVYSSETILSWFLNSEGTWLKYEIEILQGETSDLTGTPNILDVEGFSYLAASLISGEKYSWSVRSTDGVNYSDWSTPASFEIYQSLSIPTIPILSYPIGGASVYTNNAVLSWYLNSSYSGITFDVEYGIGSLTGIPTVSGLTAGSLEINNLLSGTQYYWRVRASNGITTTNWSPVESFTTVLNGTNTVSTPVLSWPIGGATVYTTSQTLLWYLNQPGIGLSYELQYSNDANMTNPTTVSNIMNKSYTLNGLNNGVIYYWRVRSYNGTVYSNYSPTESFVKSADNGWGVPIAASPSGGVEINTSSLKLAWYIPTSVNVSSYEIEISDNAEMKNSRLIETAENFFLLDEFEDSGMYYWRVRSKNTEGESSFFSQTANFSIPSGVTNVDQKGLIPDEFALKQNYPNPFNPSATFEFSIVDPGVYIFTIYNLLGEKVATLMNEELNAGYYKINFDAGNLTSGMYIYTLSGNNKILSKKMVLMK